jgi:hypothetical protein
MQTLDEAGTYLLIIGAFGTYLWHRGMHHMLAKIQAQQASYFKEWVAANQGTPSATQLLQLIRKGAGWPALVLTILFLMVSHLFLLLGMVIVIVY